MSRLAVLFWQHSFHHGTTKFAVWKLDGTIAFLVHLAVDEAAIKEMTRHNVDEAGGFLTLPPVHLHGCRDFQS